MAEAGEAEGRSHGLAEADPDLSPRGEPESPGDLEDEPGLFSSSGSLPFAKVSEVVSSRSSSLSSGDISFRSSVGDMELEDDDMMYRLMQSEYEEIPSFRWIPSPLRWWKTKRSRGRTHPSKRSDASGTSSRSEKPEPAPEGEVERGASGTSSRSEEPEPAPEGEVERGEEVINMVLDIEAYGPCAKFLGKGSYGTMYTARLESLKQVAAKILAPGAQVITREEFEEEVNALRSMEHYNLMPLRSYHYSEDEKILFFDYMPKGSLWATLHDRSHLKYLHWSRRMNIAIGISRGLLYLHTEKKMVHGNLTSRNVLLDDFTNAKISDYGISNIRTAATDPARIKAEALWYRAPEFSTLKMANTKTDVYSLGVIIIELLTGKSSEEAIDGLDLLQWVALTAKEGKAYEVFDLDLLGRVVGKTKDKLLSTLYLALRCVDPSPKVRPEALQVLLQLERIKQGITGGTSDAYSQGRG